MIPDQSPGRRRPRCAPMSGMSEIVLLRHGQTQWSATGRHTSYTEKDLTPDGERQARVLAERLADRRFAAVWCSPRVRARRTAELAGLPVSTVDEDLAEWDYGEYEGLTTPQIREKAPGWNLWTDGCPGGETPDQIGTRLDRALDRIRPQLDEGDVAVVGHGHALRVLAARWLGLPAGGGALLRLDTGTVSALGYEHARPVVLSWNCP
jgi:broad specificity phosphatase PhoE